MSRPGLIVPVLVVILVAASAGCQGTDDSLDDGSLQTSLSSVAHAPAGWLAEGAINDMRLDSEQTTPYPLSDSGGYSRFDISIGPSAGPLTDTFADNFAATPTQVFVGSATWNTGDWPVSPDGVQPAPFGPAILFTTPYVHTGGSLVFEFRRVDNDGGPVMDTQRAPQTTGESVYNVGDADATVGTAIIYSDVWSLELLVERGAVEECDDEVANSDTIPDACRLLCVLPFCGDGVIDMMEGCDNGVSNNDTDPDACRTSCALASCGDGVLDLGEECDDGEANSDTEPGGCRMTCLDAFCGDDIVDSGEFCDDGNTDDSDECAGCVNAACGDGFVQDGVEDCDDGNADDGDGCDSTCRPEVSDGDMGDEMDVMGGEDATDVTDSGGGREEGCGCQSVRHHRRTLPLGVGLSLFFVGVALRRRRRE